MTQILTPSDFKSSYLKNSKIIFDRDKGYVIQIKWEDLDQVLKAAKDAKSNVRNFSNTNTDRFRGILRRGEWDPKDAGSILFDTKEHLIDGQHRIKAHYLEKKNLEITVKFNCSSKFVPVDQGFLRKPHQIANTEPMFDGIIAAINKYGLGIRWSRPTGPQLAEEIEKYLDILEILQKDIKKKPNHSIFTNVIIRAMKYDPKHQRVFLSIWERIKRAVPIQIGDGKDQQRNHTANELADYLSTTKVNSEKSRQECNNKVEMAIANIVEGKQVSKLCSSPKKRYQP